MPTVTADALGGDTPACRVAVRRFEDAERDFNVFRVMFWAFCAILLGFLILAIALFVAGKNTSGLVSLVGTVSTGAGATFVVRMERNAQRAAREASRDVGKWCETAEVKAQFGA